MQCNHSIAKPTCSGVVVVVAVAIVVSVVVFWQVPSCLGFSLPKLGLCVTIAWNYFGTETLKFPPFIYLEVVRANKTKNNKNKNKKKPNKTQSFIIILLGIVLRVLYINITHNNAMLNNF